MKRAPWIAVGVLALAGATRFGIRACGPDMGEIVFSGLSIPDIAPSQYDAGKLGILRPGFSFQNRVVAYRWLSGLGVSNTDQEALLERPAYRDEPDPARWLAARSLVMQGEASHTVDPFTDLGDWEKYPRLTQGTLDTAASTLVDRLSAHGDSSEVRAWIHAQDQVFMSARGNPVIPEPVASPAWLKADREYQIAAAKFYAEQFDGGKSDFLSISKDPKSPWQPWGLYLAARCEVRRASLMPPPPLTPNSDPTMPSAAVRSGALQRIGWPRRLLY